jgi:hypothetical protein
LKISSTEAFVAVSSFKQAFQQKLDIEVAGVRTEHPEFVVRQIAEHLSATIWEIRSSLKRLGIVMPEGHRPRLNPEN